MADDLAVPQGLGPRGAAFWTDVTGTWEVDRDERELLAEACRSLDQLDALQAALDSDGVMVTGSTGQLRVHPAIAQINATRATLGRLLAQIGLPDEQDEALPSMASLRARKAAETRWARHHPRGGARGA